MHIRIDRITVRLLDENDSVIEEVEADSVSQISEVVQTLKWENYRVQDYLEEMSDIAFDAHYDGRKTHQRDESYDSYSSGPKTYEQIHYTCTVGRSGKTWKVPYFTGTGITENPEMSGVLECVLDDVFSLEVYTSNRGDTKAMGEWAEDLGYGQMKGGITKAVTTWNACWDERDIVYQIFTSEELKNIKHAFEEGRKR